MPPSLEAMEDLIKQRQVTISLSDINEEESFAHRIFTLRSPDWSIQIGRGNSVDQGTIPGPDNAWFTSKVVSRHHATIKAHPRSMILTIEDNNSMHGTYLNETTVKREPMELLEGDVITFGTDIVRHHETFSPLKTRLTFEWMEEESLLEPQPVPGRNTFTADYSDQEIFSEDEIEIVKESVRQPSVEILDGRSSMAGPASSSTNSPGNNSIKSAGASSATTTRIDLSADEEATGAKVDSTLDKTTKTFVELEDTDEEPSDMEDYPISPSENFSMNDMDDIEDESDYERDAAEKDLPPQITSMTAAEKAPREPSPSDAALPALRSIAPPKIQSVPPFASLMPPPPPSFLSSPSDETYKPHVPTRSPFSQGYCGFENQPTSYQSPQPYSPSAPFGYDFSAMNPPSSLRAPAFASYGSSFAPTWGYHSISVPQPPVWTESSYGSLEGIQRPNKRKAGDISSDSEDDIESEIEDVSRSKAKKAEGVAKVVSSSEIVPDVSADNGVEAAIEDDTIIYTGSSVVPEPIPEEETAQVSPAEVESAQDSSMVESETIEPPRKRARTEVHEPQRNGSTMKAIAKYAATASAGAVVGAVGVIIGLASLPTDYFA